MARAVNAETLSLIQSWEGFRAEAYPDPGSRDGTPWTIGFGQTTINGRAVRKGDTIAKTDALVQLKARLATVAATVERLVKVPLSDNQFGALVAFTDNVGVGGSKKPGFSTSTLLKKLNAGNYDAVPTELAKWRMNDGKVMEGLVNRRAAEAGLWAKGAFVSTSTVDAKAEAPKWLTPETMAAGGGLLTGATGIASGSGPVQWALGVVFVIAAIVVGYLIISKRVNPK
jgi:lysozyme